MRLEAAFAVVFVMVRLVEGAAILGVLMLLALITHGVVML